MLNIVRLANMIDNYETKLLWWAISKKQLDIHKPKSLKCKWRWWLSFPGIPPHIDTHSAFEDTILSLSLGAQVNTFLLIPNNETQTCAITVTAFVETIVLTCERVHFRLRWISAILVVAWFHWCCLLAVFWWWRERADTCGLMGEVEPVPLTDYPLIWLLSGSLSALRITPRKFDVVPSCEPHDNQSQSSWTLSRRGTRTSFTFRKIRHEPCRCGESRHPLTSGHVIWNGQLFSSCLSPSNPSSSQPSPLSVTVRRPHQPLKHRSPHCPPVILMQLIWKKNTCTECTTPSLPISAALAIRPGPVCANSYPRSPLAAGLSM